MRKKKPRRRNPYAASPERVREIDLRRDTLWARKKRVIAMRNKLFDWHFQMLRLGGGKVVTWKSALLKRIDALLDKIDMEEYKLLDEREGRTKLLEECQKTLDECGISLAKLKEELDKPGGNKDSP